MRSSDTPATDAEPPAPQAPADWSLEIPSDDRLSPDVRARLGRLVGAELGLEDRAGDGELGDEQ